MDLHRPLGTQRVAGVRDDEAAIALTSAVTGLNADQVRERFKKSNGRSLVRNAFTDVWPWQASALGGKTVAIARDAGLHAEVRWVTRGSKHLVSRRLNALAGNRLLRNAFWDLWPVADAAPPVAAAETPNDDEHVEDGSDPVSADEAEAHDTTHDTDPPPAGMHAGALISSRYDVKEEIGRGGFGTSWLAYDRLSGLDVVLKVPHADDGGAIRHELELAFQIVHPNICQAFPDRDDETGQPFLTMQHGGIDLRARLERQGWKPFPLPVAIHVLTSIADALDYLHDRLIVHLDVSPMNILIDDEDVVRLTDFGSSARARSTTTPRGNETVMANEVTSIHGLWSAPELFRKVGRSRSDQYSLFLVFTTLLTGRFPRFPGDVARPPFDVLTQEQNAAVARALSVDAEERFETCGEAARAVADGVGRVPHQVLATDLDRFARDLLSRLKRESARTASTNTTRVGAVIKIGRGVENLLLAAYLWLAAADGFDPVRVLRDRMQGVSSIHRATAGQLATMLRERGTCAAGSRTEVNAIISDLASSSSSIYRFIRIRNEVAHGAAVGQTMLPAATDLSKLLEGYLSAQGA